MLAKCPNALRVLRLRDFGKQKFFNVSFRAHCCPRLVCAKTQNFRREWEMINDLYRPQCKFRADFAKNTT
ncbi:hypothetical protein FHT70_004472 [Rhizobium sp. BK049]|nr:hypothetical protein [Rhizobium sp. BK049]